MTVVKTEPVPRAESLHPSHSAGDIRVLWLKCELGAKVGLDSASPAIEEVLFAHQGKVLNERLAEKREFDKLKLGPSEGPTSRHVS